VTPDRPRIKHSGSADLALNQNLGFSSSAVRHVRNRMLLWYPTQVRFKPVSTSWDFGDGQSSNEPIPKHSWSHSGVYNVDLTVNYSVKYRVLGKSEWQVLPGLIAVSSLPLQVRVGQSHKTRSGMVRLVHWNCNEKPRAYGC
jgi:hypothetical protein